MSDKKSPLCQILDLVRQYHAVEPGRRQPALRGAVYLGIVSVRERFALLYEPA